MALKLKGSTSGFVALDSPAVAGNNTITLPDSNGSANQVWANDNTAGVTTYTQVTINRNGDIVTPGTLSIGGTITYEDVTNVDSVGLVTAAQGVRINGGGLSVIGITTGISLSGVLTATNDIGIGDSIFHIGDDNTRIRFPAADTFAVDTGGSERFRIDSAGNVGIGEDSPASRLHLANTGSGNVSMTITNDTTGHTAGNGLEIGIGGAEQAQFWNYENTYFRLATNNAERLRITADGRVLIGGHTTASIVAPGGVEALTTAAGNLGGARFVASASGPNLTLAKSRNGTVASHTIVQSGDTLGVIKFSGSDGGEWVDAATIKSSVDGTPGDDDMPGRLVFATTADGASDSTERMRIDSSGRVMIGNTVAANLFSVANNLVVGSGSGSEGMTIFSDGNNDGYICFADGQSDPAYRMGQIIYNHAGNKMHFRTNGNTDRLVINADGNANFTGFTTATQYVTPNSTGSLAARNKIDNGAMDISQRGGAEVTVNSSSNVYLLDRWVARSESGDAFLMDQDGSSPYGFKNCLKFNCSTASSGGANELHTIEQNIEGNNIADFGFGGGSARDIAVSFWVKSSLTGDFGFALQNNARDRSYPVVYNIASADTWEYKTAIIPGPTSGTWLNNNGIGLRIIFDFGCGSNFRGNAGSWNSADDRGPSGAVSPMQTQNSVWRVTGVQVEMGPAATPYEYRKYGEELSRCQRYYQVIGGGNYGSYAFASGYTYNNGNNIAAGVYLSVPMRATPTVAVTANMNGTTQGAGGNVNSPSIPSYDAGTHWIPIGWGITSDLGANNYGASVNNNANAKFTMSAEI